MASSNNKLREGIKATGSYDVLASSVTKFHQPVFIAVMEPGRSRHLFNIQRRSVCVGSAATTGCHRHVGRCCVHVATGHESHVGHVGTHGPGAPPEEPRPPAELRLQAAPHPHAAHAATYAEE